MASSEPAAYAGTAAPLVVDSIADRVGPNARLIALLALGHFMVDVNQGALPAILPSLKTAHQLSYGAAATIVLAANVTSSLIQPLFGYLADRTARRWMLPLAVFLSGLGVAATGVAPGYPALLALIVVMGLGVAAFHPEGYKATAAVAGDRKATALSWFAVGGNVGIALGPPFVTALVVGLGLAGSLGLLLPTAVVAGLLVLALPRLDRAVAPLKTAAAATRDAVNRPGALAVLIVVVMVRSWSSLGFTTFVPFYYVDHLQADPRIVGTLLFVFLGAGALGTLIAGPIADRWSTRRVILVAFLATPPVAALFLNVQGVLAFVCLALMGALLTSTFTLSVLLGQTYMPKHAGLASGLIIGFAIGAGGLGVTLLGWIADRHGLIPALWISALMPFVGFAAALLLPASHADPARAR